MRVQEVALRRVIIYTQQGSSPSCLGKALENFGCEKLYVDLEPRLLEIVDRFSPDCAVVICSAIIDAETMRVTEQVRRIDNACPVLVVASKISAETVVGALRSGASDVLEQDAGQEKTLARLKSLTGTRTGGTRSTAVDGELAGGIRLAGNGEAMRQIRCQIARIAAAEVNVLITGETGTGKELVAQLIHRNSARSSRPFVAVNCAALPDALLESELFGYERGAFTGAAVARDGKLQHVSGGVLFLDEIGDMSLSAQAKILRVIETRMVQRLGSHTETPVQMRLVAATNQPLETMTKERRFREDLYFRLNVVRLEMPPLRERLEDIPELVDHIVQQLSLKHKGPLRKLGDDVIRRFQGYHWPGNIREMRNMLEAILVLSSSRVMGMADLPSNILQKLRSSGPEFGDERSKILSVLKSTDWNRNEAARVLSCSRMTLYRKMVKYNIAPGKVEIASAAGRNSV